MAITQAGHEEKIDNKSCDIRYNVNDDVISSEIRNVIEKQYKLA